MSSLSELSTIGVSCEIRAAQIFAEMRDQIYRRTDRMFAGLMIFQWLTGIAAALIISPLAWAGGVSSIHLHVWAAILIGGVNALLPLALVVTMPGKVLTRHVIAVCQMVTACLLIDLTGGRIETHFHFFGSLAFLAFYRDWRVLVTASIVAGAAHLLGGFYLPQQLFGVLAPEPWRWLEHVGWVAFEDFFLIVSIVQSLREMRGMAFGQARLQLVNATIEREVEIRTAEVVEAREDALAASLAKSEFLSSMSHEIRTPMNAILGMTELLDETPLAADQKRYLSVMRANGDALLVLINDILDLARVESGRMTLEHVDFDLEDVMCNAVETLAVRAHEKGLELVSHFGPEVPLKLVGDQLRIRQILINLVGNAIKFTGTGQVVVSVEKDCQRDGALHFSIADTGIGMKPETLARIFSNFTQADSSTTRRYGGSGLGLAIVKQLTELMKGKVWVESEVGRGSVFHLSLPLETQGGLVAAEKPAASAISLVGTRVLVVDDSSANRLILREMLIAQGAVVTEAEDGPSALAAVQNATREGNSYKLMLLDCRMPGMDGIAVAHEVRAMFNDGLTVMMLSSDDFSMTLARAQEAGLDSYLIKPVRRAALFEAIGNAMHKSSEAAATAAEKPPETPAPAVGQRLSRILVSDDSPDNRLLIQAYLKNLPTTIDEAENGAIAVEKATSRKYDLILMDLQMPVMDGFEAIRRIRQWEKDGARERTRILALTASALESDVRRCLEAGADLHLSKPVKKRVLLAAVQAPGLNAAEAA